MSWVRFGTGATVAAIGGLMARYAIQRERLERSWLTRVDEQLSDIGEVDHVVVGIERRLHHTDFLGCAGHQFPLRLSAILIMLIDGSSWLITRFHCEMPAVSTKMTSCACMSNRSARIMPEA